MPDLPLAPSRMVAASPSHYRGYGRAVSLALLLLGLGFALLFVGLGTGHAEHRVERTIAANQPVAAEVYREGRATYRDLAGEVRFARVPDGYGAGGTYDFLLDPGRPDRLQSLDRTPAAGWIAPTCAIGGSLLLVTGLAVLTRSLRRRAPTKPDGPSLAPRWDANLRMILGGSPDEATEPQVRPWLPPETDGVPANGSTGVLRYAWASPIALAVLAGIFSFALPQLGGPGRELVPVVGAVLLWLPVIVLTLAAAAYRVTVGFNGQLVIRTLVNRRRYDLTQLTAVTGWTWSIDRADVQAGKPRLGCWNLGLHFRDGRHLFWSPTNVRDHELVGRAIRWWALRTRAEVTPDMAYGLGLVPDPRATDQSPLPIAHDDPVLRRPGRRVRSALIYLAHVGLTFLIIGAVPAVATVADRTVGPAPDPRVFASPCELLAGLDLAGPFGPADDPVAWQGCGAGENRDVWLTVNPSLHAAPRTVRYWLETNDDIAVAPILDPVLLSELAVDFAQLVVFDGGERVTIAYLASEVSGIASVTAAVTDGAGRPLSDAERFEAVVTLVRAVTTSPQGNQPVRSFRGDGAGDRTREQVIESALAVEANPDQLRPWLPPA